MRWLVSRVVTPRPAETLADKVGAVFLLVLAAGILVLLALAGLHHLAWNRWRPASPQPVPAAPTPAPPVCLLDTPTLRIELLDDDAGWAPEQEQLWDDWADTGDQNPLSLASTTPPLPGLHGRLVTAFSQPWHGGLLLQVVEAAADGAAVTSWLGWADPATQTWQLLAEAGEHTLYHAPEAPANVIDGWNQQVGKIRLELQPAPAAAGQ
ncbi:hypothetical protein EJV47_07080 [Hymenobacter gummosus]|uniref:Uncharacterized protein n=1 Tax=Hymenobacter gummosus TaxID=1776032 RepID=A0A3S0JBW7_9BACT|nr:hypothetical protein [Hymenobacter gummosus]RTQ51555.1 hypothetical protein EJV47_07080 [Hymenobacter gummosus]